MALAEMRLNRIPRVPHSCLKLNFVPTFVLTFVVFTYAILGSGGGVLLHSGERLGLILWTTSGASPVVDIYFFDGDIFFPVEDMGNIFSFLPVEDKGSVCGQARSGAGPGGYAGHAPTHSPRERPRPPVWHF